MYMYKCLRPVHVIAIAILDTVLRSVHNNIMDTNKQLRYSASSGFCMKNVKNISLCQVKSDVSDDVSATQGYM